MWGRSPLQNRVNLQTKAADLSQTIPLSRQVLPWPIVLDMVRSHICIQENLRSDAETVDTNQLPQLLAPSSTPYSRSHTIASRSKSTPMTELIRRVNSLPGSPFPGSPRVVHSCSTTPATMTAYSPYLKSSRSALSRIAPLHPNRRTPPPPLPRAPPPKKTKKQIEKEEKWEEELSESVEGWACMTDEERAAIRRAKRASEEEWED